MGRVRLKIKRLECSTSRLTTYSKRKNGLLKKANELSVLCDVDVVLLMFSPSGRPVLWKAKNSSIETIVERYAELTPQERAKRKLESFDALKRCYKKSDHEVNAQDFFGSSFQTIGDLTIRANLLRCQLSQVQNRLRDWNNLDKIDNSDLLDQMEDYVRELIDQIQVQKENIRKQQFLALGYTNQFHNGTHLPFSLGIGRQVQHFSWIHNDDSKNMVSPREPNLLRKRETELTASNSLGNFSGYFGTVEKPEIARNRQESGVLTELLKAESLRNELIGLRTQTLRNGLTNQESLGNELMKTEYLRSELIKNEFLTNELMKYECLRNGLVQAESLRNELTKTESLRNDLIKNESVRNELMEAESSRMQMYELYSYPQYNFGILTDKKIQPTQQMNLQLSIDDYYTDGNSEPPRAAYESSHGNWACTSGPSLVATPDDSCPQQDYSPDVHIEDDQQPPLHVEDSQQPSPAN